MPKFNHAYDIAFEVITDSDQGDATESQLLAALMKRIANLLESDALLEAIGCPSDTFEEEPDA
jgi:hypothetical protein